LTSFVKGDPEREEGKEAEEVRDAQETRELALAA
jgi:hypothetical protein